MTHPSVIKNKQILLSESNFITLPVSSSIHLHDSIYGGWSPFQKNKQTDNIYHQSQSFIMLSASSSSPMHPLVDDHHFKKQTNYHLKVWSCWSSWSSLGCMVIIIPPLQCSIFPQHIESFQFFDNIFTPRY